MFENCTDCLFNDKILLKSQQRFKSDYHNVCTEQIVDCKLWIANTEQIAKT